MQKDQPWAGSIASLTVSDIQSIDGQAFVFGFGAIMCPCAFMGPPPQSW
jgi:hypothetical protein